jgi:imidazoleglycerol-phosphate dehydratase/histidinol-phosphatase
LSPTVENLATAEGLAAHCVAMRLRREAASRIDDRQREATARRKTKETVVNAYINLDGLGSVSVSTGIGFLDHMLTLLLSHAGVDALLAAQGDLQVDEHHTVEDVGIVLGRVFLEDLGEKRGIERYGFTVPMDDALAEAALDLSGRAYLQWSTSFSREKLGELATEMVEHFFRSFCEAGKFNLAIKASGENEHHKAEAIFKAVGRALRQAVLIRANENSIPSTKGSL